MAQPIHVWRLDELKDKHTIRTADNGAELKIEELSWRLWLHDETVKIEHKRETDGRWEIVESYPAKTS